jgi:pimeloyl-ACP methyl ester carboxylesterase
MSFEIAPDHFTSPGGTRIAFRRRPGRSPTLLFLPGYASDMDGAKAVALDAFAARRGLAMLRFDYSGTGASGGCFSQGTLEVWLHDALAALNGLTEGPVIAIGSSMGGWIALHLAQQRPDRIAGLVGIAAAPDFTDWGYSPQQKAELRDKGRICRDNPYGGEPQLTTLAFWESGERLQVLHQPIEVHCPVRLVHGDADTDVPLNVALKLFEQLRSSDVQLIIIQGGGHRLSEPHEIEAIERTVAALLEPLP